MRILTINQNWFSPELREFGHEVISAGTAQHLDFVLNSPAIHIDNLIRSLPNGFQPERIIWFDNSAPITILGLEDCSIPTLMYSVDTHHHHVLHSYVASSFDHVLVAQKDYIPSFSIRSTPTSWFPLWASEHIEPSFDKLYGAVFVGTLNPSLNPARVEFFEKLKAITPITVMQGHFPTIFPRSEIVVNQTVKGDLNFRVFEAMMSGALLLTEWTSNGLLDLFEDGVHLVTYTPRDPSDAASKISTLLGEPARMRQIARAGRDEILRAHLATHRARELERIVQTLSKRPRDPRRHYGAAMNLYSIASVLRDSHPAHACEFMKLSVQSVQRALGENAAIDGTESLYAAKACLRCDLMSGESLGAQTLSELADALPGVSLFQLLKIRALLNRGLQDQALLHANGAFNSANHSHVFASAEQAASELMQEYTE